MNAKAAVTGGYLPELISYTYYDGKYYLLSGYHAYEMEMEYKTLTDGVFQTEYTLKHWDGSDGWKSAGYLADDTLLTGEAYQTLYNNLNGTQKITRRFASEGVPDLSEFYEVRNSLGIGVPEQ